MSGDGLVAAARPCRCDDIAAAVARERSAAIDHLRGKIAEVQALARRGRVPAVEADMLVRRLDAAADEIGQGLHRG